MTEVVEAELRAAVRKFLDENGAIYYGHIEQLVAALMLPVGFHLAQAAPFVEPSIGTTSETPTEPDPTEEPKPKRRAPRKKAEPTDESSGT